MRNEQPIFLARDEHLDEIMRHWGLLWPLPHAERVKRIKDISDDIAYEAGLRSLQEALLEEPYNCERPGKRGAAIWTGLIAFDLAAIMFGGYLIWEMIR